MLRRPVPTSILDLAPVPAGSSATEALRRSTVLVRRAEQWGYHRYWVAEHHNMTGIASSSPAVLLAHLGAGTERIRLGSGGVMLPNHAPLVVAEQFGTLEALHPGRIDLGIGRAPGTDQRTAAALRRGPLSAADDDFPEQFGQLLAFLENSFPEGHPYRQVRAVPSSDTIPAMWLLGSSGYSAQVAAFLGLPFAFAHHFMPANTLPALEMYRTHFRPSATLAEPYAMIGVAVVAADTDAEAHYHHSSSQLSMLRLRTGRPGPLPSPEEAAAYPFTASERSVVESATGSHVVGSAETVAAGLDALIDETAADEIMVTTMTHSHEARLRSYELVATLAGLPGAPVPAGSTSA